MSEQATEAKNTPDETIRVGNGVKATIWKNEGEKGPFFKVELSRSYKDKAGDWQSSKQFSRDQLLHVARAATAAYDYLIDDLAVED